MPRGQARFALIVTLWGIFVSNVTLTILTIALPYIARDLGTDRALTNWVSLGPMLVVALLTTAAGSLADSLGRKRLWIVGSACALLGMLGSALAPSIYLLILARLFTGVGTGLMVPAGMALATALYPLEERATPIGYWTSTVAVSPMLGVILGGELLEHMSWRWLFAGQIALGLPALFAAFAFAEDRPTTRRSFDWEGSLAVGAATTALMLGATWLGKDGLLGGRVLFALGACALSIVWAWSAEQRAEAPVLPPALLANESVRLSIVARLTMNFAYMGAFMTLPYLLSEVWQLSAARVSWLLLWRPLAMGVTGPIAGRLSPRVGPERLVLWGGALILGATLLFVFLDQRPNTVLLVTGLAVAGVGLGLSSPGTVAVVTMRVDTEALGAASGLMTLTSTLANALGMAGMFAAVEVAGGIHSPAAYRVSFLFGTAVVAAGVLCAVRLNRAARSTALAPRST